MKRFHDSRILRKEFHIGQKVLLFNSRLKLISGKLWSRWDGLLLLLMFFPMVQLRLKMKVIGKVFKVNGHQLKLFHESPQVEEEFVADLSFVLPILCDDVPWMTLEEFPSLFFYMLSLCLHFITCSHWGQCVFQVWGKGLEKSVFCFPFLLFLLLCLFLFSCILFCLFFCICMLFLFFFYFLFCCICFVFLFSYFYIQKNKKYIDLTTAVL